MRFDNALARFLQTLAGHGTGRIRQSASGSVAARRNARRRRNDVEQLEARLVLAASISGRVFADLNGNQQYDAGEPGVAGQQVTVTASNSNVTNTTTQADDPSTPQDETGLFTFNGLTPGAYSVDAPFSFFGNVSKNTPIIPGDTFAQRLDAGFNPSVSAGLRFDADTIPEVAIITNFNRDLRILTSNGDNTYTLGSDLAGSAIEDVLAAPRRMTSADINGDLRGDLIIGNANSNRPAVLRNNGAGGFEPLTMPELGNRDTTAVAAGFFNDDSSPDIAVASLFGDTIYILHNSGTGSFPTISQTITLAPGTNPTDMLAADVTGDGRDDLVVANLSAKQIRVFPAQANGQLQTTDASGTLTTTLAVSPDRLTAGDFNGDGKVDIAASSRDSGRVRVLVNNGNGRLRAELEVPTQLPSSNTEPAALYAITSGDYNADGLDDLSVADSDGGFMLTFLLSLGNGTFQSPSGIVPARLTEDAQITMVSLDYNQDGADDVVMIEPNQGFAGSQGAADVWLSTSPFVGNYQVRVADGDELAGMHFDISGDGSVVTLQGTTLFVSDLSTDANANALTVLGNASGNGNTQIIESNGHNLVTQVGIPLDDFSTDIQSGAATFDRINIQANAGDDRIDVQDPDLVGKGLFIQAGDGNDTILPASTADTLWGGSGIDTIEIDGAATIDLRGLPVSQIQSIERIDLTDNSVQSLSLNVHTVKNFNDSTKELLVAAGAEDTVSIAGGWTLIGTEIIDATLFNVYRKEDALLRVSAAATVPDPVTRGFPEFGETGTIAIDTPNANSFRTITLQRTYINPVVIAQPPSFSDESPVTVRIRDVQSNSFRIQLDAWDYLSSGAHARDRIGYMVVEAGTYILPDGGILHAGLTSANQNFTSVSLESAGFTSAPVVFSQSQTVNGTSAIVTRQKDISATRFKVRVQEEEGGDDRHAAESIGYVAITPGVNTTGMELQVARTGNVVNNNFKQIGFARGFGTSPVLVASMQTFNDTDPASLRFKSLVSTGVRIKVEEEQSRDTEVTHGNENVGYFVAKPGLLQGYRTDVIGEAGSVTFSQANGTAFQTVNLQRSYTNPVVIAQPASANDSEPVTVRIRNVSTTGFQVQLDEWDYLTDAAHGTETVHYIVVEAGTYSLPDGGILHAGMAQINSRFQQVSLAAAGFTQTPVILSQSQTVNGVSAIVTRQRRASSVSFEVRVQEEQNADDIHSRETVGFVAISTGNNQTGMVSESGLTASSFSHQFTAIRFAQTFAAPPVFVAGLQTYNGRDPATLRYRNLFNTAVRVSVEEEQSFDAEVQHGGEQVGFFAVASGFLRGLAAQAIGEVATVRFRTSRAADVEVVPVSGSYTAPAVIAQPASLQVPHPTTVRIEEVETSIDNEFTRGAEDATDAQSATLRETDHVVGRRRDASGFQRDYIPSGIRRMAVNAELDAAFTDAALIRLLDVQ